MTKFLLIFQMCYSITGTCLPPVQEQIYNSHRECSLNGYYKAHEFIVAMPEKQIEDRRAIITFWCEPHKIEKNEKKIDT